VVVTQTGSDNGFERGERIGGDIGGSKPKKGFRPLFILVLVFLGLVTIVLVSQNRDQSIAQVEDYQEGIELAKQQNKPMLLIFYKQFTTMSTNAFENTYNNKRVIKYVEANFVAILIDVDKQPEIAKLYNVSYYPTHYVQWPDSDQLFGPRLGYDSPTPFIKQMNKLLDKAKAAR